MKTHKNPKKGTTEEDDKNVNEPSLFSPSQTGTRKSEELFIYQ